MEEKIENKTTFRLELANLINKFSKENGSDTPDYILASYLTDCLEAFDSAVKSRTLWYKSDPNDDIGIVNNNKD